MTLVGKADRISKDKSQRTSKCSWYLESTIVERAHFPESSQYSSQAEYTISLKFSLDLTI